MVDRDLLLRKLADLDVYVAQVREFGAITAEEYRRDWKTQRIVERTLQMAIEVCADVADHIIADRKLRVPATYTEAFEILEEAGILTAAQREAVVRMSGFRNTSFMSTPGSIRRWSSVCSGSGWATSVPSGLRFSEFCSPP